MPNTSWSCVVDLSVFDEFPDDLYCHRDRNTLTRIK
jgi:hypothetical protein